MPTSWKCSDYQLDVVVLERNTVGPNVHKVKNLKSFIALPPIIELKSNLGIKVEPTNYAIWKTKKWNRTPDIGGNGHTESRWMGSF